MQNSLFIVWLIIAILLYSYNFLILLIPTTTQRIRPEDKDLSPMIDKKRSWLAVRLLLKKRKLAIEIGLTVLLGGIVPLSLSFSIIFGLAMFFASTSVSWPTSSQARQFSYSGADRFHHPFLSPHDDGRTPGPGHHQDRHIL